MGQSWTVLGRLRDDLGGDLRASWGILGRLAAILGTLRGELGASWGILRRLGDPGATWCAVLAWLMASKPKIFDFPLVFKAKRRKIIKIRCVLKATDGKTATRIKKK